MARAVPTPCPFLERPCVCTARAVRVFDRFRLSDQLRSSADPPFLCRHMPRKCTIPRPTHAEEICKVKRPMSGRHVLM
ncbi:hypothetical protein MTR_2g038800 [Medicago truncatula]|uniref:Uncharacterized protein n=1 Tax=Medicago truncatula TaxID=3880 RepID=G7IIF0_MEDTR|nr:hypothetical protein MTR_2g038800 [Medicago truncatula]